MTLITTPTGNIGSKVLSGLLNSGEKIRVLARDPAKLSAEVLKQVEVIQGSLDDREMVIQALRGIEQMLFIIPPSNQYEDADQYYLNFSKIACAAIKEEKIKRVVFISGTGLGFEKKAGAVYSSFLVEEELKATGVDLRILHCGTFMENLFHAAMPIKIKSQFATTVPGDVKCPWVATKDIADVAVRLLTDKNWKGQDSVGILGPKDLSYGEIANIIGEVLKKEVTYSCAPEQDFKATLVQYGSSEASAQGLVEIYASMTNGVFNRVERTPQSSSPTPFHEWCETVFKPMLMAK